MTKYKHLWARLTILFLLVLLAVPLHAQDATARDPEAMAQRWLGWTGGPDLAPPLPAYKVGTTTQFWVTKAGHASPTQITATLGASLAFIDLWIEDGLDYKADSLDTIANRIQNVFIDFQLRENQGGFTTFPRTLDGIDNKDRLPFPDVDGDQRYAVLFAKDLNTTRNIIYNPVNNQTTAFVANGWTNQQGMFVINTSAAPSLAINDLTYVTIFARAFYSMIMEHNNPAQSPWMREAQSWYMLLNYQGRGITPDDFRTFFQTPDLPLTSSDTERNAITAVGQMFLNYIQQRFGPEVLQELFTTPGSGFDQLTNVLAAHGMTDMVTDNPITGQDVFADFAMTNAINLPIGDTRFAYVTPAANNLRARAFNAQDNFDFQNEQFLVQQYGTNALALVSTKAVDFQLSFNGLPAIPRLPMPEQPNNHFYWSGNGLYQNTSLTRTVDLSAVQSATLTFDVWHQLSEGWNYAYVSTSDDGGKTFKPLVSSGTTTTNPNGLAYGAGFTGISNPQPSRPFPYLGIGLESNGITISSIADNSPLQGLDVQVGDTIAGHDGQLWQGKADITAYLSQFKPGDVISLYLQRDEKLFSVDVVLAKHPSRVIPSNPIWTQQEINLNAYAGKQIILRFDYVSADDKPDNGIAIDNIAIPEIGFKDDAEAGVQGWSLNGWQLIDNVVPQHYVVQYALLSGTDSPTVSRVVRLIGPHDTATSGAWTFSLNANDILMLVVSGINDATDLPTTYTLSSQSLTAQQAQPPESTAEATAESTAAQ
ncbi:MAG: PDZ domain-containing protein [Anaerolineaceae bacterium]|nr:PDZ domain-containing protein [Anaerolineaceae bacterium]